MGHQRAIRGDGSWIKGALLQEWKHPLILSTPYAHRGYRATGVPGRVALTQCTSVSNNGISMPSVFFGGRVWFVAGSCWVVCSLMCAWTFKGMDVKLQTSCGIFAQMFDLIVLVFSSEQCWSETFSTSRDKTVSDVVFQHHKNLVVVFIPSLFYQNAKTNKEPPTFYPLSQ